MEKEKKMFSTEGLGQTLMLPYCCFDLIEDQLKKLREEKLFKKFSKDVWCDTINSLHNAGIYDLAIPKLISFLEVAKSVKREGRGDVVLRGVMLVLMKTVLMANELAIKNKSGNAESWMMESNPHFQNDSPLKVIMRGDGKEVIKFLEERL